MEKVVGDKYVITEYLLRTNEDLIYELSEHKVKRSLNANAYFHLLCNELAQVLGKSNELMKIELNLSYGTVAKDEDNKTLGCCVPKGTEIRNFYEYSKCYKQDDKFDYYIFYKRTSELNSKEFSILLNGTVQECKNLNIETLDDKEIERLINEIDNTGK